MEHLLEWEEFNLNEGEFVNKFLADDKFNFKGKQFSIKVAEKIADIIGLDSIEEVKLSNKGKYVSLIIDTKDLKFTVDTTDGRSGPTLTIFDKTGGDKIEKINIDGHETASKYFDHIDNSKNLKSALEDIKNIK